MAIRSNFEIFDVIDPDKDFSITAVDLDNNTQTVISSENAIQYLKHKYGTRLYPVLRGMVAPTVSDAKDDFQSDFRLWVLNRQHNINKQYQALFDYDYSPIENVDRYETETTVTDNDTTYGKTETESGTDSVSYGKTHTKTGSDTDAKTGYDTTQYNGVLETETERAGFNTPNTYTPDSMVHERYNNREDRNNYNSTDTLTHNTTDTDGGTDRTTYGKTITDGGTDQNDINTERTLRVHGNIGVTRSDELVNFEIETRKLCLAEMLLDNFINDYTFYC